MFNITRHTIINYDHNIFLGQSLKNSNEFHGLCISIKEVLGIAKLITEKYPKPIENNIELLNRRISNNHDKLFIFAVGKNSTVSMLTYQCHDKHFLEPIYNGRGILLHEPLETLNISFKLANNNLFSVLLCDFKFYNINESISKSNNIRSNFHSHYSVI